MACVIGGFRPAAGANRRSTGRTEGGCRHPGDPAGSRRLPRDSRRSRCQPSRSGTRWRRPNHSRPCRREPVGSAPLRRSTAAGRRGRWQRATASRRHDAAGCTEDRHPDLSGHRRPDRFGDAAEAFPPGRCSTFGWCFSAPAARADFCTIPARRRVAGRAHPQHRCTIPDCFPATAALAGSSQPA